MVFDTLTDVVRTVTYWPLEEEHGDEGVILPWSLFLAWVLLGVVASFQNVWFGLALVVVGFSATTVAKRIVIGTREPGGTSHADSERVEPGQR